jgi:hypothetical protein
MIINTSSEFYQGKPNLSLDAKIDILEELFKKIFNGSVNPDTEKQLLAIHHEAKNLLLPSPEKFRKALALGFTSLASIVCALKAANSPLNYKSEQNDYSSTMKAIEYTLAYLELTSTKLGLTCATASLYLVSDLQDQYYQHQRLNLLLNNINRMLVKLQK